MPRSSNYPTSCPPDLTSGRYRKTFVQVCVPHQMSKYGASTTKTSLSFPSSNLQNGDERNQMGGGFSSVLLIDSYVSR